MLKRGLNDKVSSTDTCKGRCEVIYTRRVDEKNKNDNSKMILLPSLLYCTIKRTRLAAKILYVDYGVYTVTT